MPDDVETTRKRLHKYHNEEEMLRSMNIQEVAEHYDNHYEYSEIHIYKDDELVELVTNGYSDNEDFIWRLNMFTRHCNAYVGELKAGKYYYDITGSTDGATYHIMKLNDGDDE